MTWIRDQAAGGSHRSLFRLSSGEATETTERDYHTRGARNPTFGRRERDRVAAYERRKPTGEGLAREDALPAR
jgi:hypothetical protein